MQNHSYIYGAKCALRRTSALVLATCCLALAFTAQAFAAAPETSGELANADSTTITTGADGVAYVKLSVASSGTYTISAPGCAEVDGDTVGYLYDSAMELVAANDDRDADTSFSISTQLSAGTYYLEVYGKQRQENVQIVVELSQGSALNVLKAKDSYDDEGGFVSSELGSYVSADGKTQWNAADAASYQLVGYVYQGFFQVAQEDGAIEQLKWNEGLPPAEGRYVIKFEAAAGSAYSGALYHEVDNEPVDFLSLLDPNKLSTTVESCGARKIELGSYTIIPTNWEGNWRAASAGSYSVVGYCLRSDFVAAGCDETAVTWSASSPLEAGQYIVKLSANPDDADGYVGDCYLPIDLGAVNHVSSGEWVVTVNPTYNTPGTECLYCKYCGQECALAEIPALKGSSVKAGSGASAAYYKVTSSSTVSYGECAASGTAATVPATVKIYGKTYKVKGISGSAFKGTKVKTLIIKSKNLSKSKVKNSLKASKVKTIKVAVGNSKANKTYVKKYKKMFTSKNCGKSVTVK